MYIKHCSILTLRMCQDILDLGLWDLTLPPGLRHPGMSWYIPGHIGPGSLGPNAASTIWDIPGCPWISQDILDLGLWDLTLPPGLGHPGMSQDILGLGLWDLTLPPRPGCPWISQDILDLGLWDLTLPPGLGHPGMSWYIPGHLGPGTLGLDTASRSGTSRDVSGYPRTSWTWDSGTKHCLQVWNIPGCPRISKDILDLGLWDQTLPPGLEHPGMSPDIPGHLGPGTLRLNTASRSGTSQDVPGYPWTSWTWDSGT